MNSLIETDIFCPYCGEEISVAVEVLDEAQEYIEDCQVCCQPIVFHVEAATEGEPMISVHAENETF